MTNGSSPTTRQTTRQTTLDTLNTRRTLDAHGRQYAYYSLPDAGIEGLERMPVSMKVLLENLLRHEDGTTVTVDDIRAVGAWQSAAGEREIAYRPARVLMQDFTGVPGIADLAAMREAVKQAGKDPSIINPLSPVDLVIDHSVMVDRFGTESSFEENVEIEMARNAERYRFLRWGQKAFDNFRVVPPGTGICHQVNLEYLSKGASFLSTHMDTRYYRIRNLFFNIPVRE